MLVATLSQDRIQQVRDLMELGAPYIRVRTYSDYWLYASLFSSSCPVALVDNVVVGAVIAFRSQDKPDDVYVQDVMIHPEHRNHGIARTLLAEVRRRATEWGCVRLYLTSEPENTAAHATWMSLGFVNMPGERAVDGISVVRNFKGPGRDRAVYQLNLDPHRGTSSP
ncbi:MAG: GNAT family N-acetyltransferase [Pseudonocardiaceae bacterium]